MNLEFMPKASDFRFVRRPSLHLFVNSLEWHCSIYIFPPLGLPWLWRLWFDARNRFVYEHYGYRTIKNVMAIQGHQEILA